MTVRSSDEDLGLEVDTSDEESEELNYEHSYAEPAEDTGSSSDSENEPSSPFTPKSPILPPLVLSRRPDSPRAEESVTGKFGRQQPRQSS